MTNPGGRGGLAATGVREQATTVGTFVAERVPSRPAAASGRRAGRRTYPREALLEAIRRWVVAHGEPPTTADWEPSRARKMGHGWRAERFAQGSWPTMRMVRTEFGTLSAAVQEAGFAARPAPTRVRTQLRGRAEVLKAIRVWAGLYGEPPAMSDWDPSRARRQGHQWRVDRYYAGDWPSARTVCHHFGNLGAAVAAAGLRPRPQGQHAPLTPEYAPAAVEDAELQLHEGGVGGALASINDLIALRVRALAAAGNAGDAWSVRAALVDLAAASLASAETLGGEHPTTVMELLALRRAGREAAPPVPDRRLPVAV